MPALTLSPVTLADLDELQDFEQRNRAFFEHWINARPPTYYSREGVAQAIEAARRDAEQAFAELALWRLEATSRVENPASIQVLTANGFVQFGHARRCFQLGETWFDLLHFEAHAQTR